MRSFYKILVPLSAIALLTVGQAASASTATGTLGISATVANSCSFTTSPVAFGSVDVTTNSNIDNTGSIDVTCTNGVSYNVGLDAGGASGATVTSREMSNGAATPSYLSYALYSDSARTTNWGNTVGTDTLAGTGTGGAQTLTVYGRIPSGQTTVPAGSYSDTVNVTVTY